MKTETKLKIFAQSIGHEIRRRQVDGYLVNEILTHVNFDSKTANMVFVHNSSIIKTPLSKITDEDAVNVIMLTYPTLKTMFVRVENGIIFLKKLLRYEYRELTINLLKDTHNYHVVDYLRAKGYALPITVIEDGEPVTYSVEQQFKEGVIILK